MTARSSRTALRLPFFIAFTLTCGLSATEQGGQAERDPQDPRWSTAGRLAQQRIDEIKQRLTIGSGGCRNEPECEDEAPLVASTLQSETSIAVDATGQHVVVGFNDFRGFADASKATSLSGFMYSDDGGLTFTDGGQLPSPGTDIVGGQRFPQIFGDPDVKYVAACTFLYASIGIQKFGASGLAQALVVHRSTDCGHTWTGPFSVPPTINPNGGVDVNGNAGDAADKELTDVDPDTGRYMLCWTNFSALVEISCTYSEDILSPTPTFAPRRVVATRPIDGQGSSVRFAGNGSPNVVVAWSAFPSGLTNRVSFARSTDNGQTWSAPTDLTPSFLTMDEVLGNDRINSNPSVAIDRSAGPFSGTVYVVYSNNNSRDGADVAMQRSVDGGVTFTAPILLNSRPGADRPQWFPYVTVDRTTGRAIVFYYDQGIDSSGHLTEVTYTYSDDGGTTWSPPAPMSDRPFKAGWGNDGNQPNLGDYNQAVAQFGTVYASFASTRQVGFADGQPSASLTTPDVEVKVLTLPVARPPLRSGTPTVADSGGNGSIDPGEQVSVTLPLTNYVTNPLNATAIGSVTAIVSSVTPGVAVVQGTSGYDALAPGATAVNLTPFLLQISPSFVPGTPIELAVSLLSAQGPLLSSVTLPTGTLVYTTLLDENFDASGPGRLPAGWAVAHGGGATTVPWTTTNAFDPARCGTSNKAFHANANDAAGANQARWERLFSPTITVPATSNHVSVDFDVCYNTEDDPNFRVLAYDGFFLRITDLTPGRTARAVLAEAFEQVFTTDGFKHYPKHLPRNSDPAYFQDMSAWAGASGGIQHVHLELPGMAGSLFQLRFEFTQDQSATCADVRPGQPCGVSVDNVVVRNMVAAAQPSVTLATALQSLVRDPVTNDIVASVQVTNTGSTTAFNVALSSALLGAIAPSVPLPVIGALAPGASANPIVRFPASAGIPGAPGVLRLVLSYDGGSGGGSFRVVVP